MSTFKNRLTRAMEARGIRATQLSQLTGLSKARISQYKNGIYTPRGEALCRLAEALGVSEAWLMGKDCPMEAEARELPADLSPLRLRPFPVLGRIACGEPLLAVEDTEEFMTAPEDTDADFCLIARGDSMVDARIFDGDEVLIQSTDMVNNGEIAAVILDDEATLKRFFYYPEENRLVLAPENAKYEPMVFTGEDLNHVRIVGRAIAVQSRLK